MNKLVTERLSLLATVPLNLETLLKEELLNLGASSAKEHYLGVMFRADLKTVYRVCLYSRIASRVILVLKEFPCSSREELYHGTYDLDWPVHFKLNQTFAVNSILLKSELKHRDFASQVVKDAVADRFRSHSQNKRPAVDKHNPDVLIYLQVFRNRGLLGLDLSGESLHKRGYRKSSVLAALKENVAAAILLRSLWPRLADDGGFLLDPMCGSGTFAIEAALMALNKPAGFLKQHFGFNNWQGHNDSIWREVRSESRDKRPAGFKIFASDSDPKAMTATTANINAAGLDNIITTAHAAWEDLDPAGFPDKPGIIVCNPPYGLRIKQDNLRGLYQSIGALYKKSFKRCQLVILTNDKELSFATGLKAAKVNVLYNGPLKCLAAYFDPAL